jgi:Cu/Ag efflux protein CusF
MRNLLDESSIAQSLDGNRLMGSLLFPATDFLDGVQCTRNRNDYREDTDLNFQISRSRVRSVLSFHARNQTVHRPLSRALQGWETNMKIAKIILASATAIVIISSGAFAQQALTGSITKVDEASGKITIQQTQSGTVGANTSGAAEDFKVQDGLLFNALQAGDKVVFTATEIGGVKTITKLEKQ